MKGDKYTKKEIINLVQQIERLGMSCSITQSAIKKKKSIVEIRQAFSDDSSIIQGQINDIGRLLHVD